MPSAPPPPFARYVALGDSSTEGIDDPDGAGGYRGWSQRLAERIAATQGGLHYANLAVRGLTTAQVRAPARRRARDAARSRDRFLRHQRRHRPALMQPMVSDDVAAALTTIVVAAPVNGMIEIASPEVIRQDDLVRRYIRATGDARTCRGMGVPPMI